MHSFVRGGWPHPLTRLAVLALVPGAGARAATAAPPVITVKTGVAGAVGYASATLAGTVGPHRQPTTYFFQYGPTTKYGSQSQPAAVPAAATAVAVASRIDGLNPLTRYHFRLVTVDVGGTGLGADASFTTATGALSITFAAMPSPAAFGSPLTIAGAVNGTGGGGRTVVLQQNPYPFAGGFQTVGNPQVTSPTGAFEFT